MIKELDEITRVWERSPVAQVPPGEVILVTDFDGTLAEVVQDPAAARARPEAVEVLEEMALLLADVIVLSSRPPAQLEQLVQVPGVRLIGDSGLAMPRHAQREALDRFNAEPGGLLERVPGAWLEVKPASTAIHFRNTDMSGEEMLRLWVRWSTALASRRRLAARSSRCTRRRRARDTRWHLCFQARTVSASSASAMTRTTARCSTTSARSRNRTCASASGRRKRRPACSTSATS